MTDDANAAGAVVRRCYVSAPLTQIPPVMGIVEGNFDFNSTPRTVERPLLVTWLELHFLVMILTDNADPSLWSARTLDLV